MVIHWVSKGENRNPKPNPISFAAQNLKTMGEKSSLNPIPLDLKPTEIRPKTEPLPSLCAASYVCSGPRTSAST